MKEKYEEMSVTLQNILNAIGNVEQPSKAAPFMSYISINLC